MSNLPWYRMYTEARTDAKLQSLTDAEHRVWFRLLCFAADQDERGTISGYDEDLLAVEVCNADVALLRVTLVTLCKLRIISVDKNSLTFCAFARRQHTKPSNTPERIKSRVAKHRANKKQANVTPVTPHVTPGNALKRLDRDREVEEDGEYDRSVSPSGKVSVSERVQEGEPLTRTRAQARQKKAPARHTEPIPMTPKPPNPLWDVLVEVFYAPTTPPEKSNFGKIVKQLTAMGATPDDVRLRVKEHAKSQNHWELTPNALMNHWSTLAGRTGNSNATSQSTTAPYDPAQDEAFMERRRAAAELVRKLNQRETS